MLRVLMCLGLMGEFECTSSSSRAGDDPVEEEGGGGGDTVVQELEQWRTGGGEEVGRFLLSSSAGMEVEVMAWGATLTRWVALHSCTPLFLSTSPPFLHLHRLRLRDGRDVVLGFDTMDGYEGEDNPYFGATVGRVANRCCNDY